MPADIRLKGDTLKLQTYSLIVIFQIQLCLYIGAHLLRIYIVCKQIRLSINRYIIDVLVPMLKVLFISFVVSHLISYLFSQSFLSLFVYAMTSIVMTIGIVFLFGLKGEEKMFVVNCIENKIL